MVLPKAIDATLENKRREFIHHSDKGSQYCPQGVRKITAKQLYTYQYEENAEWLDMEEYTDFLQAKERISQIINIYNQVRPHASCNMLTPTEAERHRGNLKKSRRKRKHERKAIKTIPSRTDW
jgi:transposase InsO family protein